MAREYHLDTQAAKEANSGSKRIKESGPYTGKFKAAWYEKNDKGTESVHFQFESDDGQEAGPLALYTHNGEGKPLPSYNTFNAILTCLKIKNIKASPGKVDLYDYDSGSVVQKTKETYPDLVGKPVGLLLQREEYEKRDGSVGERMVIFGPFTAGTRLAANEVLESKTAGMAVKSMEDWIAKNPVKKLKNRPHPTQQHESHQPIHGEDPFHDEIPW